MADLPLTASSKAPTCAMSSTTTVSKASFPYLFPKKSLIQRALAVSRTVPRTLYPAARNSLATWLAINPLTPVTSTKELGAMAVLAVFSMLLMVCVGYYLWGVGCPQEHCDTAVLDCSTGDLNHFLM